MNLKQAQAAARAALEQYHYTDTCTVTEYQDCKDKKTKLTKKQEITVLEDIPCKLSFETVKNVEGTETVTNAVQNIKLFLDPNVTIFPGSKILVTHENKTTAYSQSGVPAVYPSHQEIVLTLFQEFA